MSELTNQHAMGKHPCPAAYLRPMLIPPRVYPKNKQIPPRVSTPKTNPSALLHPNADYAPSRSFLLQLRHKTLVTVDDHTPFAMICILCSVDFEDLARHLAPTDKNKCSRVFTAAYKGYALKCHGCNKELGARVVENALKHAAVCDPEETESETEEDLNRRSSTAMTVAEVRALRRRERLEDNDNKDKRNSGSKRKATAFGLPWTAESRLTMLAAGQPSTVCTLSQLFELI